MADTTIDGVGCFILPDSRIVASQENLDGANQSAGDFIMNNPGITVFETIDQPLEIDIPAPDYETTKIIDSIRNLRKTSGIDYLPCNSGDKSGIFDPVLLLTGGGGSLDRMTVINLVFVEGNGDAQYDWSSNKINEVLNAAGLAGNIILAKAYAYGIKLNIRVTYTYIHINSEPYLQPSGISQAASFELNSMASWQCEAMVNLGYEGNFRGVLSGNIFLKSLFYYPEGITCFITNLNDKVTHADGSNPNYAGAWNEEYRVSKGYLTCAYDTYNAPHMEYILTHEILKCFGAAGESVGDWHCDDPDWCNPSSGKLMWPNDNCEYCGGHIPCVMKSITNWPNICYHTARQIGWLDTDDNGGSDVDDIPILYHTLKTGQFNYGDRLAIYDAQDNLVNAMVISSYNSDWGITGNRTVFIPGSNYHRQNLTSGTYFLYLNGTYLDDIEISTDANHPPLFFTDIHPNGPFLSFYANNYGHFNLEINRPGTGEIYIPFAGNMESGGTEYQVNFNYDWFPDGYYSYNAQTWTCDGVNWAASGDFMIDYGLPPDWDLTTLVYNTGTDSVYSIFDADKYWTKTANFVYKGSIIQAIDDSEFVGTHIRKWKNTVSKGSDSVTVNIRTYNPNGYSYSNQKFYFTIPNPPINILFTPVYVNDHKVNAIAVNFMSPYNQVLNKLDYYQVQYGYDGYNWKYHNIYASPFGGGVIDTIWNTGTYKTYQCNMRTYDIRGRKSAWGLPQYATVTTGQKYYNPAQFPADPEITKANLPREFRVSDNYPNPFNPSTSVDLELPNTMDVKIEVFNLLGRKITTMMDDKLSAGYHTINWDGRNSFGRECASGVYFCRITAGEFTERKTMLLMK